jgi:hypothetical protein
MDVMNASFGTDDSVLTSAYTGLSLLLPSAKEIGLGSFIIYMLHNLLPYHLTDCCSQKFLINEGMFTQKGSEISHITPLQFWLSFCQVSYSFHLKSSYRMIAVSQYCYPVTRWHTMTGIIMVEPSIYVP